jgi:membrane fusion protein (multidrug efflux system)
MTAAANQDLELTAPSPEIAPAAARRAPASRRNLIIGGVALAAALGVGSWVRTTLGHETTDDAQVDAEVVSVPARMGGTIAHILFVENQTVHAGDVLATLDDDQAKARLAQAEASLASAEAAAKAADADARVAENNAQGNAAAANASLRASAAQVTGARAQIVEAAASLVSVEATLRQAQTDRDRDYALFQQGAVPRTVLDQTETALSVARSNADASRARLSALRSGVDQATGRVDEASARAKQQSDVASLVEQAHARAVQAHAQVATAMAARDLAGLDLSYTRIVAPHDGVVSKKTIAEGQSVAAGQGIVQLVTPGVWITANFKETQLARMRKGSPVEFSVDAYPSLRFQGEVESLSGAMGSRFTLLPPDNASGNFTKIVQRLPVRVRVTDVPAGAELRPGMSVDVNVNTRG